MQRVMHPGSTVTIYLTQSYKGKASLKLLGHLPALISDRARSAFTQKLHPAPRHPEMTSDLKKIRESGGPQPALQSLLH